MVTLTQESQSNFRKKFIPSLESESSMNSLLLKLPPVPPLTGDTVLAEAAAAADFDFVFGFEAAPPAAPLLAAFFCSRLAALASLAWLSRAS